MRVDTPERKMFRYGINAAPAERLAPNQSPCGKQPAPQQTKTFHCLKRVSGAGGIKPAARRLVR